MSSAQGRAATGCPVAGNAAGCRRCWSGIQPLSDFGARLLHRAPYPACLVACALLPTSDSCPHLPQVTGYEMLSGIGRGYQARVGAEDTSFKDAAYLRWGAKTKALVTFEKVD